MYTIKENSNYEIEINKSRFITYLYKISSFDDVNTYLEKVKKDYKDATHYCYGYILNNEYHFSDDGEPGGTAGLPIYEVLRKKNLNNILCIVVRYFGGIKLGAGGLVRAYTKSVTSTLDNSTLVELIPGYKIEIIINYDDIKKLDYILKDINIMNKDFNEIITYTILIDKDKLDLINNYNYTIINEIDIEKDF